MANKTVELLKEIRQSIDDHLEELGDDSGGSETVTLPESLDELAELSKEDTLALAGSLHLDIEDLKLSAVKALLATAHKVVNKETDDLDEDEVQELATSVGILLKKKDTEALVEELQEFFETEDQGNVRDVGDAKEEEEDDDDNNEKTKASDEDDENDADGVDRVGIAKKAKLPKLEVMESRLKLYNKHYDESEEAEEIKEKSTELSYRKLLALMINSDGEVVQWGTPYIANNNAMCCGLQLKELKNKGGAPRGQCLVTEKVFDLDVDDSSFEEVEE